MCLKNKNWNKLKLKQTETIEASDFIGSIKSTDSTVTTDSTDSTDSTKNKLQKVVEHYTILHYLLLYKYRYTPKKQHTAPKSYSSPQKQHTVPETSPLLANMQSTLPLSLPFCKDNISAIRFTSTQLNSPQDKQTHYSKTQNQYYNLSQNKPVFTQILSHFRKVEIKIKK